jgi:branched-chain amino acid transport system ATP-binding protein
VTHLLEMKDVCAWYGQTQVLHSMSLSVSRGGITALLGANGTGKTTTLRAICNVLVRQQGTITFNGEPIQSDRSDAIVRRGIAHVPDGRGTFVQQTVEENLHLGAYCRSDKKGIVEDFDRVYALFPKLKERRQQQAGTLSGGEQQMLAIGRAMMLRPKLILLDEPSFGLAPLMVKAIFEALQRLKIESGVSLLLVEQNANLALELANYAYLIEGGRVAKEGAPQSLRQDEAIRRVYLGG